MLRRLKQRRADALQGRQTREIANAIHRLAVESGEHAIGSQIYRINQLPYSKPEERLAAMRTIILNMVDRKMVSSPNQVYAVTQPNGARVLQLGARPDAVKLALPPALNDYVRFGAQPLRAAA